MFFTLCAITKFPLNFRLHLESLNSIDEPVDSLLGVVVVGEVDELDALLHEALEHSPLLEEAHGVAERLHGNAFLCKNREI